MTSKLYWCSWNQPTEDHRPIKFPPNEQILGWWCSGNGPEGATLCAWVKAEDEPDVLKTVNKDWPEITSMEQFRFCEEKEKYEPCDRFPIEPNEWMQERMREFAS